MPTKPTKRPTKQEQNITSNPNEPSQKKLNAIAVNHPAFMSALVSEKYGQKIMPELDLYDVMEELKHDMKAVNNGDLKELENMLLGQAKALQTMFVTLARMSTTQEYLKHHNAYATLALKSQAQSRATIQALIELKYPRQVVVTQQANFSAGHQQVNNGTTQQSFPTSTRTHAPTHAGKNQSEPNELMDIENENTKDSTKEIAHTHEQQRLDTRTTRTPIASHTPLATVGTLHGRKNP